MKFLAVLGSWGCREKTPNCHKYATFWGGFSTIYIFSTFGSKINKFKRKKLEKNKKISTNLKVAGNYP